jgi:putative addiction module CopG family antidote
MLYQGYIMNLSLPTQTQELIQSRVRSGKYASPEDVVTAAVAQLDQQEQLAEFEPGELDALLLHGEQSGPALDGEQVLAELRSLGRQTKAG